MSFTTIIFDKVNNGSVSKETQLLIQNAETQEIVNLHKSLTTEMHPLRLEIEEELLSKVENEFQHRLEKNYISGTDYISYVRRHC